MGGDQTNPQTEDLFARALTADSPGEAFLIGIRGLWDKINLGYFLSIIGNIAEGAGVAVQAIFRGVLDLLLWFPANLDAISDAMMAILKIVAVLLTLILVFVVARGVYKKAGIVIMPFDVSLGEAISGRAISDLLAGELRRISEIHKLKFEEITIKSESLSLPALTPKGESLEHSMPQVTTVGDGQASAVGISISQIIIAFKRHCPGLKYFTDALALYHCYTLTGDFKELDRSRSSCLKAVHSERCYEKAIDFLKTLGQIGAESALPSSFCAGIRKHWMHAKRPSG